MSHKFVSILEQARHLSPLEKIRLVENLLPEVENALNLDAEPGKRLWRGIFQGEGPIPTDDDIREMRREAWS